VRALPPADDRCGWWGLLPPRAGPVRRLAGDGEADAVVIGAGFTGLAAARRLAELRPGWRVVVLDAGRAGSGASGRSSGFLVDIAFFTTAMEPAAAERHVRLSRAGIDELRRRVAEAGTDCDWDDRGWFHAAAGETGYRDLATLRQWLDERGEPYAWLDAPALAEVLGTRFYRAGIRLPGRPLVQPAALVRGLAADLPRAVELYEDSPVRTLAGPRAGGRGRPPAWRVTAGDGTLSTPRVLLATNGCTPALGFLGDRVFPLLTFGSLTRPLAPGERAALGGEARWGVLAQDAMGSTLRRTGDGRLLVRNTLAFDRSLDARPAVLARARQDHRRALARRFPALGEVELELTWSGVMGVTPSRRHYFGRLEEGLWATAGFTGAGIAQGTIAGSLLAELACGEDSQLLRDMLSLPPPGRLPPRPLQDLGIRWRVARMNAGAGETL
jgi:glycine/D-amino acid oxidase-like deaminating enzyme